MAVASPSAEAGKYRKQLKALDEAIREQPSYHEALENEMRNVLAMMDTATSDSLKWTLAYRLYKGYHHYSMDSVCRYQHVMEKLAVTPAQKTLAADVRIRILLTRGEVDMARNIMEAIDMPQISDREAYLDYLQCRILVNTALEEDSDSDSERMAYRDMVSADRAEYVRLDSTSFYSRRMLAAFYRDNGDIDRAMAVFMDLYPRLDDEHNKASIAYNISRLYDRTGDQDSRFEWLVLSAVHDFRNAERAYMSLYEIAVILYEHGQYAKAEQYINKNLMDIMAGNFSNRFYNSGKAKLIIAEAANAAARSRVHWLAAGTLVILILLILILFLLRREVRLRNRLRQTNKDLVDANKIKNSYVFRYMELSVHYIDRIAETRNEIRTIAKNDGADAVVKHLKSPSVMYREYDAFYRIFDETFLGLYPDFVDKVNELLREDARFDVPDGVLPTELRVLAAIRIGITESGKIAKFLKCSPNTVYTYRTRLKRLAICPKEDFEAKISQI